MSNPTAKLNGQFVDVRDLVIHRAPGHPDVCYYRGEVVPEYWKLELFYEVSRRADHTGKWWEYLSRPVDGPTYVQAPPRPDAA